MASCFPECLPTEDELDAEREWAVVEEYIQTYAYSYNGIAHSERTVQKIKEAQLLIVKNMEGANVAGTVIDSVEITGADSADTRITITGRKE